ncbi:MAG: alpha/beta hydrolase [Cytophagaceae bacterium]|nr:alpha/beta hydrolase [Cytophagaceae bacterium]
MKKIFKVLLILSTLAFLGIASLYFYYNKESKELTDSVRKNAYGKFIKLSKGYVHYEIAGPDKGPLVIFLHGAGSGYYAWDKNFYELAQAGFKVLRYDLYGRGLSDRPDGDYNLQLFTDQLKELRDSLNLNTPCHIVAVSMGAMIAIDQANKNPEDLDKLILIDPAAISNGDKHWTLKTPLISDLLMTIYWSPRAVDKQMNEFHKPERVPEYAEKSKVHLEYKGLCRAMLSTWLHTCTKNMDRELEMLGRNKKEVLLIWGKNDPLTPVSLSKKYRTLIPHTQYAEIENAGHLSNYEQPEIVNKLLIGFLQN